MIATTARAAYASNAVTTASPARLLVMLYDRLARDLVLARERLAQRDLAGVHEQLVHAQQIVVELRSSLDLTTWDGAQGLADLYDYLLQQLVTANVSKDDARMAECQDVVEPLRSAWHEAALASLRSE